MVFFDIIIKIFHSFLPYGQVNQQENSAIDIVRKSTKVKFHGSNAWIPLLTSSVCGYADAHLALIKETYCKIKPCKRLLAWEAWCVISAFVKIITISGTSLQKWILCNFNDSIRKSSRNLQGIFADWSYLQTILQEFETSAQITKRFSKIMKIQLLSYQMQVDINRVSQTLRIYLTLIWNWEVLQSQSQAPYIYFCSSNSPTPLNFDESYALVIGFPGEEDPGTTGED